MKIFLKQNRELKIIYEQILEQDFQDTHIILQSILSITNVQGMCTLHIVVAVLKQEMKGLSEEEIE